MSQHIFRVIRLDGAIPFRNLKKLDVNKYAKAFSTVEAVSDDGKEERKEAEQSRNPFPPNARFIYPEFLPDPTIQLRHPIKEKLERRDMLMRRANIDIPEFYTGSVLAVTRSNEHAPAKSTRFLGLCIEKIDTGLKAKFTLRNTIDGLGFEMKFYMYDPTIQKIEVLRLEKRLDEQLPFMRDALPEFCTFPLDMEPELLPEGAPVPVNSVKVKLKPRPWSGRWERCDFKGVDKELLESYITDKMKGQRDKLSAPWEKYDLMKQYRNTIPEEEQNEIYAEVYSQLHNLELSRKKIRKRREFVKPKKAG